MGMSSYGIILLIVGFLLWFRWDTVQSAVESFAIPPSIPSQVNVNIPPVCSCDCDYLQKQVNDWQGRVDEYSKKYNQCVTQQLDTNNFINSYVTMANDQLQQKYRTLEQDYKTQVQSLNTKYNELVGKLNLQDQQKKTTMNSLTSMRDQLNLGSLLDAEDEKEQQQQTDAEEEVTGMTPATASEDPNGNNMYGFSEFV